MTDVKTNVAVFVDGAYLDKVLELNFQMARIDYGKFVDNLVDDLESVMEVHYYHCPPYSPPDASEDDGERISRKRKFFGALSNLDRFKVHLGHLVFRGTSQETNRPIYVQKRIDGMLTADMVSVAAEGCQKVYLIAGDSDFAPAVEAAKDFGSTVVLVHGTSLDRDNNMVHNTLAKVVHGTVEITQEMIKNSLR